MTLSYDFLPEALVVWHVETAAVVDEAVELFPFKRTIGELTGPPLSEFL
jgi:hypothetical protein